MEHSLETERLKLYPFKSDDLDLLHRTFTDPFVRKYLWDDEIISIDQTKDILLTNETQFARNSWGLWKLILKSDNSYAGFAGLWIFFDEYQPQLIYGLLPEKTKCGYAYEASQAVIEYAFHTLKFEFIIATFDAPNVDSRNVCEKLNLSHRKDLELNGKMISFYQKDKLR